MLFADTIEVCQSFVTVGGGTNSPSMFKIELKRTSPPMRIMCLLLNILFPGIGTMVNACLGPVVGPGMLYGLIQGCTTVILVGWIWSIVYGIKIMKVGKAKFDDGFH